MWLHIAIYILSMWVWGPEKAIFKGASYTGAPFSPGSDIFRKTESQMLWQNCGTSFLQWMCYRNGPQLLAFRDAGAGMPYVGAKPCRKGFRQDPLKLISTLI